MSNQPKSLQLFSQGRIRTFLMQLLTFEKEHLRRDRLFYAQTHEAPERYGCHDRNELQEAAGTKGIGRDGEVLDR